MTIEDNIRSLAALRFFSRMEPEALRMVAFATESRNLRAGDVLFRQGDVADCGYLILSGANDYVSKPFRFSILLARIRAH
ncbi:MAG: hypothetical protein WB816_06100, partial [Methylocystis sp.]